MYFDRPMHWNNTWYFNLRADTRIKGERDDLVLTDKIYRIFMESNSANKRNDTYYVYHIHSRNNG